LNSRKPLVIAGAAALVLSLAVVQFVAAVRFAKHELSQVEAMASRPRVTMTRPTGGDVNVLPNVFVATDVHLPNVGAGIDASTMTSNTVRLLRADTGAVVAAQVNTSGAGDAIVCQPLELLEPSTTYIFQVSSELRDTSGAAFEPFQMTFTTASGAGVGDYPVAFEKVPQPHTQIPSAYTGLTIGPDGRLYAGTYDGRVMRFDIAPDGSLGEAHAISTVQRANGGPRLITGIVFDPASTAADPILWIGHGYMALEDAPNWSGKISRLSGSHLEQYQDIVINLPRAAKDHLNFQMEFGPDGAIYFCQGSNTSIGGSDKKWAWREEQLLTAAVLRLDPLRLRELPLDVKTEDGGSYDPYAGEVPLTIYATGVRSGYDLFWHSNGHLYVGLNGAAAGGNTPSSEQDQYYSGPRLRAIKNIRTTTPDLLLKIKRGGYYGHPNPRRHEYVLMGGNPTHGEDPYEISAYPVGTPAEPHFELPAFNFGMSISPNGLIEYRGDEFGGILNGCILVTRYSGGDDIIVLRPGPDGNIVEAITGIDGLRQFSDPLDIVQHPQSRYLYVAEFGGQRLTLLRPASGSSLRVFKQKLP
jgi:glucose/arabinose dehydrogenase